MWITTAFHTLKNYVSRKTIDHPQLDLAVIKIVSCGVPQGSAVGFWIIYINDLRYSYKSCSINNFTDNLHFFITVKVFENWIMFGLGLLPRWSKCVAFCL